MDLSHGLLQQQTMKLAMTQQLSQAIALLQYSSQELESFLTGVSEENPLVTVEYGSDIFTAGKKKTSKSPAGEPNWIELIGEGKDSLADYLISQIPPAGLSVREVWILKKLIEQLDPNGYLPYDLSGFAEELNLHEEELLDAVDLLQTFEPAGVGARGLQECLLLQLTGKDKDTFPFAEEILVAHFQDFADKKWKRIVKNLPGIALSDIQQIFDFVNTLNPRPCSRFSHEKAAYVVPDIIVGHNGSNFTIQLAAASQIKVSLNEAYYTSLKESADSQARPYLQEKYQEYQWVIRSLEQRRETILKVVGTIVEKQPEGMMKGLAFLRPMTMKEVAEEINVHESTVSRTVKGKYIRAPFGTVEMKAFFTGSLASVNDENVSVAGTKSEIKKLIDEEDKAKPISDQEISNILKKEKDIILSRRTVAKYREQMQIPSSSKRKRF